jgi:hypothetical protein
MALQPLYLASATVICEREGFGETSDGNVKATFNFQTRGNIDVQLTVE